VIDLPEKLFDVVEYLVEVKRCVCGKIHKAELEYEQRVQYGKRLKALLVYMNVQQQIPFDRLQELTTDIFGLKISDGLIQSSLQECSGQLDAPLEQVKQGLLSSRVAHADETSARYQGKTGWLHTLSNEQYTFYFFHPKRGKEAMDAMGLLPYYKGTLIHDRWASYDCYDCSHSLCNAHLLRELKFLHEEKNRQWAGKLKVILQKANERKNAGNITRHYQTRIRNQIEELVCIAWREEPKENHPVGKRGRKRKGKALCLLDVFRSRLDDVLKFLYHEDIPFDNNLAERDLRMMKLKQKISGCFRTTKGVETFCTIRSYISTVKKQNKNVWQSITAALQRRSYDLLVSQ
jgi:transposase